ncbi:MAG: type II secretion system F family protein, partial [Bythopirellula sp.]
MPNSSLPADNAPQAQQTLPARVARLIEQRETLAPALSAFASELPAGRYRRDLRSFVARLEAGTTAEQFCDSPDAMAMLLPLLSANGRTAEAGDRLHELFAESAREEDLRRQRRRILAYPIVVSLLAVAVLTFLCVAVVPVFADIFQSFSIQLPKFTVAVIQLSDWIRFQPVFLALITLTTGLLLYCVWRLATFSEWFEWMFGYLAIGNSREFAAMAALTRRLAEGLAAD